MSEMAVKCCQMLSTKSCSLNHKEHHGESMVNGQTKSSLQVILHTAINQYRLPIMFTMVVNDMFLFELPINYHL